MWRKTADVRPSSPVAEPSPQPSRESAPERPSAFAEARSEATRIGKGIALQGELTGREDLFIDGEVRGSIQIADAGVTVGSNGRVAADIEAREIIVHGRVQGTLHGRERVVIGRTGTVTGHVVAPRVAIEDGAFMRGSVDTARPEETRPARAAAALAGAEAFRTVPAEAKDQLQ